MDNFFYRCPQYTLAHPWGQAMRSLLCIPSLIYGSEIQTPFLQMKSVMPDAGFKGMDQWLHPTVSVGSIFLSLPLILASCTTLLEYAIISAMIFQIYINPICVIMGFIIYP